MENLGSPIFADEQTESQGITFTAQDEIEEESSLQLTFYDSKPHILSQLERNDDYN